MPVNLNQTGAAFTLSTDSLGLTVDSGWVGGNRGIKALVGAKIKQQNIVISCNFIKK
jgi:hypothetical protein